MARKVQIFKKISEQLNKERYLKDDTDVIRQYAKSFHSDESNSFGYKQLVSVNIHKKRFILLVTFLFFCLLKLIGDVAFYLFNSYSGIGLIIWQILSLISIALPLFFYIFSTSIYVSEILINQASDYIYKDISNLILFQLTLIVIYILLPSNIITDSKPINLFYLLLTFIFNIYLLICLLFTLYILFKWLSIRRFKRTKLFLSLLSYGLVIIFAIIVIRELAGIFNELHNDNKFSILTGIVNASDVLLLIFNIGLAVIVFLTARKNSWIAQLPKNLKHRLLWLSLLGFILSIVLASLFGDGSKFSRSSNLLMPGINELTSIIFLLIIIWFFRLFVSTILFMPSTNIMERRTMDISSLVYLNKIISEAIDPNSLLNIVTKLAQSSCRADVVWVELYDKDGNISYPALYNIEERTLANIHLNRDLFHYFNQIEKPVLFDSIIGNAQLTTFFQPPSINIQNLSYIKSLIIVPLCSGKDRIGTLVAGNKDEYAFENDDLNLLTAFRDNICIALENARLLRDSLEKEHYKRELFLAQQMQKKLLPQSVPDIKNYSVAAFSVPAEEIGGDYYDFVKLKDGSLCVIIGDVSGKGMNAAFYMAQLKGVVLAVANEVTSSSELLRRINRNLYGNMDKQMFITLTAVILNPFHNKVFLARAGHTPIIFKNNSNITEIVPKGMGIGITEPDFFDETIDEVELNMNPNDLILLFTDGVNELNAYEGIEYGIDSLKIFFSKANYQDSVSLLFNIQNELQSRLDGKLQHDDMTVVSIIYKGN